MANTLLPLSKPTNQYHMIDKSNQVKIMYIRALNTLHHNQITRPSAIFAAPFSALMALMAATLLYPQLASAETDLPPEVGVWINDTRDGAVEIKPCGRALCGHIVWLRDPISKRGGPKRDIYNPNPQRRNQTICGLQVIGRLVPQRDGSWDGGWIYDPKTGQAYDVSIRVRSKRKLEVHGYQSLKILGKTFFWTRANKELPPCDDATQASAG